MNNPNRNIERLKVIRDILADRAYPEGVRGLNMVFFNQSVDPVISSEMLYVDGQRDQKASCGLVCCIAGLAHIIWNLRGTFSVAYPDNELYREDLKRTLEEIKE